jgi:hypothetical protein
VFLAGGAALDSCTGSGVVGVGALEVTVGVVFDASALDALAFRGCFRGAGNANV